VAGARRSSTQAERDQERDRGQGIRDVVDRVRQERDRTGDRHDRELEEGGGDQDAQDVQVARTA
jgi:hypothetical protein